MNRLFIIYFICLASFSFAQVDELYDHGLDQNKWNELRDNIRYENQPDGPGREWTYEDRASYEKASREYRKNNGGGDGDGNGSGYDGASQYLEQDYTPPPAPRSPNFSMGNLSWLGYVFIGIFIVLIIVALYFFFINYKRNNVEVKSVDLDETAPIEIPLSELQRMLQDALSKGDYRLAVRIYFVFIVRDLSEKKWIVWEKDKTNYHYLREMNNQPDYNAFTKVVGYFEVVWYGKRMIDKNTFEAIRPDFTNLLDKLGVH